ncbi:MFS transporter [Rapidithrix thailandica]|uniref:MFS transporter n=1 Tax=Rapidithrix thailandica TaxID=413964 RepID=A0AAW9SEY5_9BACT
MQTQKKTITQDKPATARIYGLQFVFLCLSSFLFFLSFNLIIPELPDYLSSMGGEEYIGLIIGLFTLTAGVSRPFSGKLADHWGRIPVMILGAVVCCICGVLYPFLVSVSGFLLLRLMHGFSTGFKPTGTSAYVADLVPANRRGEAMGILGFCGNIGMASGPALGSWVATEFSLDSMFYISAAAAILSVIVLAGMKETLPNPKPFQWKMLSVNSKEVIEPRVWLPSVILMLSIFPLGIVLTLIPDFSKHIGLENKGIFYTYYTLASLMVRILAGKTSDRYGRVPVIIVALLVLVIAMVFLGMAETKTGLLTGAVLFGLGVGMNNPTIIAWTIDLSHEQHRGKAISTMYIALETGIGVGAVFSGWLYGGAVEMLKYSFWSGAITSFLALLLLTVQAGKKYRKQKE